MRHAGSGSVGLKHSGLEAVVTARLVTASRDACCFAQLIRHAAGGCGHLSLNDRRDVMVPQTTRWAITRRCHGSRRAVERGRRALLDFYVTTPQLPQSCCTVTGISSCEQVSDFR